jgi:hypothetical protein
MENGQIHNGNGAAFAGMSGHHRSAVTNRTKLFAIEGMDGRLGPARRFTDDDQVVAVQKARSTSAVWKLQSRRH